MHYYNRMRVSQSHVDDRGKTYASNLNSRQNSGSMGFRKNEAYRERDTGYRNSGNSRRCESDQAREKRYFGDADRKNNGDTDSYRTRDSDPSWRSGNNHHNLGNSRRDYSDKNREQKIRGEPYHNSNLRTSRPIRDERDQSYDSTSSSDVSNDSRAVNRGQYGGQRKTSNKSASNERENSSTILVRSLASTVTEEDVENAISDISIRNGFSPPNLVSIKPVTNSYMSMNNVVYAGSDNVAQPRQYGDGYSYGCAVERIGTVTFPSASAASKFMGCMKSRRLKISNHEYFIEFDTLSNSIDTAGKPASAPNSSSQGVKSANVNEVAALIKKRKTSSDWICPSCRFLNFARRVICLSCGMEKPSDAVLESNNLIIDMSTLNQAQMLHTNISDVSSWVILKNIPGDTDPAKLVLLVCKIIPDAAPNLQRCMYVIDSDSGSKRGFLFAQFTSNSPVEKYVTNRGEKRSEVIQSGSNYHRLDTVRSREKHVAEELFKKVKLNTLKVAYEFDPDTLEVNLVSDESAKKANSKEHRSCKVKITNVTVIEQVASAHDAPSMSLKYLNNWLSKNLWISTGKPDTAMFTYDPTTDYFYDHSLSLYYDAASGYYMSLTGNYYIWDEASSSLKEVTKEDVNDGASGQAVTQNPSQDSLNVTKRDTGVMNIAGVLEAAIKVAQVSKESVQQLSVLMTEKKAAKTPSKNVLDIDKTFDVSTLSEDECDMEIEDKVNTDESSIKIKLSSEKVHEASERETALGDPPEGKGPKIKPLNLCFVCLRRFDTVENLAKHQRYSEYHSTLLSYGVA